MYTFLPHRPDDGPRVTVTTRIRPALKQEMVKRVAHTGLKLSAVAAELLEFAIELEQKLEPFRPAIEQLMREERLSAADAIAKLLWMDVHHPAPE